VLRAGVPVASHNVVLGPQAWEWKVFDLLLAEGANPVRVHLDDFDQVPEGDETNNEYQVTVLVKIDCDGDGKVAGLPLSAVPASPVRALRAPLPPKAVPGTGELRSGRPRR
jgi:subtilase family serine protease